MPREVMTQLGARRFGIGYFEGSNPSFPNPLGCGQAKTTPKVSSFGKLPPPRSPDLLKDGWPGQTPTCLFNGTRAADEPPGSSIYVQVHTSL
ncbi:MAG TPA: hypothetical protein VLZ74_10350 [Methylocella sp.]|nr:hypothetical protein [Methylocella sp.]